ncbi:unnamed protein product [Phytomonas sp. Hart1]|nr:unnamed protein product [Phytomonas sp. Hart1]|eukprot:CCW70158.1 unnamed protein product [Phytomonas sp. isolate Hart1]
MRRIPRVFREAAVVPTPLLRDPRRGLATHGFAVSRVLRQPRDVAQPPAGFEPPHDLDSKANPSATSLAVWYSPGSGDAAGVGLPAPTTALTSHCNTISESVAKADELEQQRKAQEAAPAGGAVISDEALAEMLEELREVTTSEVDALLEQLRGTGIVGQAGMHELRRTLFYTTALHTRGWMTAPAYTAVMRMLTVEFLRRDNNGVLAPDDVLYIATHMIAANFYNRHLWNRLEKALMVFSNYEHIELPTIKALTTKLFKSRRDSPKETLDVRRKVLAAMMRRIALLANEFDLPSLLGILQCYSVHDMTPLPIQALAVRATNHLNDFTPQESATLVHVLRKFRLLRLETCERLVERICSSDKLTHHMANSALTAIRICYNKVSDSGRNALHAEPTRQKLRAIGEQVVCRLDEVEFPALVVILNALDIIVNLRIYIPKKPLQSAFTQADAMLQVAIEHQDDLVDPKTGKHVRPITVEQGRQLQALLLHYGSDLSPELSSRLKTAFEEGLLPDEASL